MRITPPDCLNRVTPWWLLNWINHHTDTCWTLMVMWKMYGEEDSWWPTSMCFAATPERYDYCGKFAVEAEERVTSS